MRKLALLAAVSAALLAAPALTAAQVGPKAPTLAAEPSDKALAAPGTLCEDQVFEQPFLRWNDRRDYTLAPNGSFETGLDGWIVSEGVHVEEHANPFRPGAGSSALYMPAASAAVSPPVCVTPDYPVARLFGQTIVPGRSAATLRVQVVFPPKVEGADPRVKPAGTLRRERTWDPTRRFALSPGQIAKAAGPDGTAMIRLRFTTRQGAEWLIDDVFVDPRAR
jgi:hypothetical protein